MTIAVQNAPRANFNSGGASATQEFPNAKGRAMQPARPSKAKRAGPFNLSALSKTTKRMAKIQPPMASPSENEILAIPLSYPMPRGKAAIYPGREPMRGAKTKIDSLPESEVPCGTARQGTHALPSRRGGG